MTCDCACSGRVTHLAAVVEQLEHKIARLECDLARESVDRQNDTLSVRRDVIEVQVLIEHIADSLTADDDIPIPYSVTETGRMAMLAGVG